MKLIGTRKAALESATEGQLGDPEAIVCLLLDNKCHLLGTVLINEPSDGRRLDLKKLLDAALSARTEGYLLFGPQSLEDDGQFLGDVGAASRLCSDYGVYFLDYLYCEGLTVRSLQWDRKAAGSKSATPWDSWLQA